MAIINGLEKDWDTWENGTILNPESGKVYKCYITLESEDKLKVRVYLGLTVWATPNIGFEWLIAKYINNKGMLKLKHWLQSDPICQ